MDTFIFSGLLWPPQPRRSDGKPQILMWILMWKKGKNLVYLYVKLSILSIGGPRLIFMNSNKCPTMWLIKKWDVALSSRFVWRYSFSQLSIRNLGYLVRGGNQKVPYPIPRFLFLGFLKPCWSVLDFSKIELRKSSSTYWIFRQLKNVLKTPNDNEMPNWFWLLC